MIDQHGRNIEYIRISITDRCNFRCMYCMPDTGISKVNHEEILTYEEILRLCRILAGMGITKVKITGGEPLVRGNVPYLIKKIRKMPGIENVTLTTNGMLLKENIRELAEAGLDAVNISIDALDEKIFEKIAGRKGLAQVLEGLEEALKYPNIRVKVNCVLLEGMNESQWMKLAELAKDRLIDVRFIEMMPIGYGKQYCGETEAHVRQMLEKTYGRITDVQGKFGNGPSTYVKLEGFQGKIGFISAMSHKFCAECNRIRLTSGGWLKPCLQYAAGADLKRILRENGSDQELEAVMRKTIYEKPVSHHFEQRNQIGFENKKMSEIGG